ncbi:hypothetical protein DIPPA_27569 [Diplonema papillatum]|nr:hypothetical protein DIPPA_27569 [Diplonema papillatum]
MGWELRKQRFDVHQAEGSELHRKGMYSKAVDCFSEALLYKKDANTFLMRSKCYVLIGKLNEALADAEAVIALENSEGYSRKRYGVCRGLLQKAEALYARGDFEQALLGFKAGLDRQPGHAGFRDGALKSETAIFASIQQAAAAGAPPVPRGSIRPGRPRDDSDMGSALSVGEIDSGSFLWAPSGDAGGVQRRYCKGRQDDVMPDFEEDVAFLQALSADPAFSNVGNLNNVVDPVGSVNRNNHPANAGIRVRRAARKKRSRRSADAASAASSPASSTCSDTARRRRGCAAKAGGGPARRRRRSPPPPKENPGKLGFRRGGGSGGEPSASPRKPGLGAGRQGLGGCGRSGLASSSESGLSGNEARGSTRKPPQATLSRSQHQASSSGTGLVGSEAPSSTRNPPKATLSRSQHLASSSESGLSGNEARGSTRKPPQATLSRSQHQASSSGTGLVGSEAPSSTRNPPKATLSRSQHLASSSESGLSGNEARGSTRKPPQATLSRSQHQASSSGTGLVGSEAPSSTRNPPKATLSRSQHLASSSESGLSGNEARGPTRKPPQATLSRGKPLVSFSETEFGNEGNEASGSTRKPPQGTASTSPETRLVGDEALGSPRKPRPSFPPETDPPGILAHPPPQAPARRNAAARGLSPPPSAAHRGLDPAAGWRKGGFARGLPPGSVVYVVPPPRAAAAQPARCADCGGVAGKPRKAPPAAPAAPGAATKARAALRSEARRARIERARPGPIRESAVAVRMERRGCRGPRRVVPRGLASERENDKAAEAIRTAMNFLRERKKFWTHSHRQRPGGRRPPPGRRATEPSAARPPARLELRVVPGDTPQDAPWLPSPSTTANNTWLKGPKPGADGASAASSTYPYQARPCDPATTANAGLKGPNPSADGASAYPFQARSCDPPTTTAAAWLGGRGPKPGELGTYPSQVRSCNPPAAAAAAPPPRRRGRRVSRAASVETTTETSSSGGSSRSPGGSSFAPAQLAARRGRRRAGREPAAPRPRRQPRRGSFGAAAVTAFSPSNDAIARTVRIPVPTATAASPVFSADPGAALPFTPAPPRQVTPDRCIVDYPSLPYNLQAANRAADAPVAAAAPSRRPASPGAAASPMGLTDSAGTTPSPAVNVRAALLHRYSPSTFWRGLRTGAPAPPPAAPEGGAEGELDGGEKSEPTAEARGGSADPAADGGEGLLAGARHGSQGGRSATPVGIGGSGIRFDAAAVAAAAEPRPGRFPCRPHSASPVCGGGLRRGKGGVSTLPPRPHTAMDAFNAGLPRRRGRVGGSSASSDESEVIVAGGVVTRSRSRASSRASIRSLNLEPWRRELLSDGSSSTSSGGDLPGENESACSAASQAPPDGAKTQPNASAMVTSTLAAIQSCIQCADLHDAVQLAEGLLGQMDNLIISDSVELSADLYHLIGTCQLEMRDYTAARDAFAKQVVACKMLKDAERHAVAISKLATAFKLGGTAVLEPAYQVDLTMRTG